MFLDVSGISGISQIAYGIEQLAFVDYPEGNGDLTYVANLGNSNGLPSPTFKIKVYASVDEAVHDTEKLDTPEASQTSSPEASVEQECENKKQDDEKKSSVLVIALVGIGIIAVAIAIICFIIKKRA